jgi:phosphate uptake regulator
MFKELIAILKSPPLRPIGDIFADMMARSVELTYRAGSLFFGAKVSEEEFAESERSDVKINKLQRKVRKRVLVHLATIHGGPDLPYCMLLISLVKDVERIGDYAKDLVALRRQGHALPAHSSIENLRDLARRVETLLRSASDAFALSERDTAESVLRDGQVTIQKLDEMVETVASSDLDARSVAVLVLAAHYYKRICSHSLNIVTSVVQPLHRLDYYPKHDAGVEAANPAAN